MESPQKKLYDRVHNGNGHHITDHKQKAGFPERDPLDHRPVSVGTPTPEERELAQDREAMKNLQP